jgi:hypothetical protein
MSDKMKPIDSFQVFRAEKCRRCLSFSTAQIGCFIGKDDVFRYSSKAAAGTSAVPLHPGGRCDATPLSAERQKAADTYRISNFQCNSPNFDNRFRFLE